MKILSATKPISPYQFAVFRIGFGFYLTVHFAQLVPYAAELFSNRGVIGDPALNSTYGIFPNPLVWFGAPEFATGFLIVAVVMAVLFTAGIGRRPVSFVLWFIWASLFNRNNLISNPGIPYVGLILIVCALLPAGDKLALRKPMGEAAVNTSDWQFPAFVYWTAWFLLAVGYTFSGCVKLGSPSWVNGEAIRMLLENPLARPGFFRDLLSGLPPKLTRILTWGALALEILFLPLCVHRYSRLAAWLLMLGMHLGIVLVVDFADLTVGTLMIHWFTFDPDWFPVPDDRLGKKNVVFFDGVCVMCNGTVRFLLGEDCHDVLLYAPLQGETYKQGSNVELNQGELKSIVFVESFGEDSARTYVKSAAVARILRALGGFWRLAGLLLYSVPPFVRDRAYRIVADHRYRWFGKFDNVCKIPDKRERSRVLP